MASARGSFIGSKLRKLLDPKAVLRAAANPRVLVGSVRQAMFDVALKEETPAEKAAGFSRSVDALARLAPTLSVVNVNDAFGPGSDPDTVALADLFRRHGSDKATSHDYHLVYGALLKGRRLAPLRILEIGLGTNNIDVPSNMGPTGKPGASLRAFRDWAPKAEIVGADVDKRILFTEERIATHFVDQTDPETLAALATRLQPETFDLLIDDGLHTAEANLNFLRFALPLMKLDGAIVIEDVGSDTQPFWQAAAGLLPTYAFRFVWTRVDCLVTVQKRVWVIRGAGPLEAGHDS